jgi:hypothetical protein
MTTRSLAVPRQTDRFLDALWDTLQTVEPKLGVAIDITGQAEWIGAEVKAGSKLAYYVPSLVEVSLVDAIVGGNIGVDLPNWMPASVYGNLSASIGVALVGVMDVMELEHMHFATRIKLAVPAFCLGGRLVPWLEIECTHLTLYLNAKDPAKVSVYFTLGAGLALPFLPDLGKLLVQISPKLKAKSELHGIVRFDFNAGQLKRLITG